MFKKFFIAHPFITLLVLLILYFTHLIVNPIQRFSHTDGFEPAEHSEKDSLMVAAWNVFNQNSVFGGENHTLIEQEFTNTSLGNSDLIALQEVKNPKKMKQIAQQYGFEFHGSDNVLLSKLPVLDSGKTRVNKSRTAFWADVEVEPKKIVRIYSIHLSYKKVGYSPYIEELRGKEIAMLLKHAEKFNGPVIIAGDFNTISLFNFDFNNVPVIKNLHQAGFHSSREIGTCNTHIPMGEQDWIFIKGFEAIRFVCGNYAESDHRWIQDEIRFLP